MRRMWRQSCSLLLVVSSQLVRCGGKLYIFIFKKKEKIARLNSDYWSVFCGAFGIPVVHVRVTKSYQREAGCIWPSVKRRKWMLVKLKDTTLLQCVVSTSTVLPSKHPSQKLTKIAVLCVCVCEREGRNMPGGERSGYSRTRNPGRVIDLVASS